MKRLLKMFALDGLAALSLMFGLAFAMPAYAEEGVAPMSTEDWAYTFTLEGYGDTDGTAWREKNDYTASYINPTTFYGKSVRVYVDGSNYPSGANRDKWCMIGEAYLSGTGKFVIHNNVKERGNRYAQITTWAYQDAYTKTSGWWSPDVTDASKYTSLN